MLHSPESIQKQLSDAVSIIGKHDFPQQWPELIDQMVEKFNTGDFHVINGVLHTAHSLFKRYRYEFKSQALWTEIKFVLDQFAKPLTELFLVRFKKLFSLILINARSTSLIFYVFQIAIYHTASILCKTFFFLILKFR